jgi:uncharacterized membrane protein
MASPFDPRSVFLARHAQHVVLIHFPIGLFLFGVLLDAMARMKGNIRLANAAQLNLTAAAICIVPTYLTGFLAWQYALEGQRLHGVLLYHLMLASATVVLVITAWWVRSRTQAHPLASLALELVGAVSIAITAHLGGFLSGVNS